MLVFVSCCILLLMSAAQQGAVTACDTSWWVELCFEPLCSTYVSNNPSVCETIEFRPCPNCQAATVGVFIRSKRSTSSCWSRLHSNHLVNRILLFCSTSDMKYWTKKHMNTLECTGTADYKNSRILSTLFIYIWVTKLVVI